MICCDSAKCICSLASSCGSAVCLVIVSMRIRNLGLKIGFRCCFRLLLIHIFCLWEYVWLDTTLECKCPLISPSKFSYQPEVNFCPGLLLHNMYMYMHVIIQMCVDMYLNRINFCARSRFPHNTRCTCFSILWILPGLVHQKQFQLKFRKLLPQQILDQQLCSEADKTASSGINHQAGNDPWEAGHVISSPTDQTSA